MAQLRKLSCSPTKIVEPSPGNGGGTRKPLRRRACRSHDTHNSKRSISRRHCFHRARPCFSAPRGVMSKPPRTLVGTHACNTCIHTRMRIGTFQEDAQWSVGVTWISISSSKRYTRRASILAKPMHVEIITPGRDNAGQGCGYKGEKVTEGL